MPTIAARVDPTASITARTSSIRVSRLGAPATRSDMPVPRLSKAISREIAASRRHSVEKGGVVQPSSTSETNPGTKTTSNGPSPATW
jgi:hypothetical protein